MIALSRKFVTAIFVPVFVSSMLAACAGLQPRPEPITRGDYESTKQTITQMIQLQMKKHDVVGLSIALVDDQKVVWTQGFGHADKAANIAATADTVYRTGSISKLFTDSAVMQLAEQGKVNIDQPLKSYLPTFSINTRFTNAAPITPRNVMTHHSGVPDSLFNGMWTDKPAHFSKVTAALKDDYAAYPPNTIFSYSNIGITLLGDMIEHVTGRDFSSVVNQSLLQPMGMTNSTFATGLVGPLASKAYRDGKEVEEKPLRDTPAGGLNSTVLDLGRFMQMVFADGLSNGNRILQPATLTEMLRPQNENVALDQDFRIGLGWMLNSRIKNGGTVAQHGGATMYHHSYLAILPEHKLGVVVLSNTASSGGAVIDIANATLKFALEVKTGLKQPEAEKSESGTVPMSAAALQSWPGHYATTFGAVKVTQSGDSLQTELFGRRFNLVSRADGQLGLRYQLLGFIPMTIPQFADTGLSQTVIANRNVLVADDRGMKMVVGEKMNPQPISEKWLARLGAYELINAGDEVLQIENIRFVKRDGFLAFELSVKTEGDATMVIPVAPLSDTELVTLGLGRGKGETIRVVTIDGQEHAAYAGYLLRRKVQ